MQLTKWLHRELYGLFNFLLPPACGLCFELLTPADPDYFCAACRAQIPQLKQQRCPRCALPYPADSGSGHYCQTCLQEKKPLFNGVTSVGFYDSLLREAIHRFKYRNSINLDRPLAIMLAELLDQEKVACQLIIPVPLHPSKLRQRTYNQSALLARQLARRLDIPTSLNILERTKAAVPQQGLSARDRLLNVKNSFSMRERLHGESILLIDDVMTTGATARACARTLLAGGAGSVHVAILARAAPL